MLKFVLFISFLFVAGVFCQAAEEENDDDPPINDRDGVPKSAGFPCPIGWMYFAKQGICLISTPQLSWTAAEQYCQKLGGNLMSIHGRYSFANAKQVLWEDRGGLSYIWVGLNKQNEDDTWKHTNNAPPNYLAWDFPFTSKCAYIQGEKLFQNEACDKEHFGICQIFVSA